MATKAHREALKAEKAAAKEAEEQKALDAPYPLGLDGKPNIQHMKFFVLQKYARELRAELEDVQAKLEAELAKDPSEPFSREAEKMIAGIARHMRCDRRKVIEGFVAIASLMHRAEGDYGMALKCQNSVARINAR